MSLVCISSSEGIGDRGEGREKTPRSNPSPLSPIPSQGLHELLTRAGTLARPGLLPYREVHALRSHTAASGFRNVYVAGEGYVAKVKEGGRLYAIPGSRQKSAHQSAAFVACYYRLRYGRDWRLALASRKRSYWRVTPYQGLGVRGERSGKAGGSIPCPLTPSPSPKGWVVTVWVRGQERLWMREAGSDEPRVFAFWEEAYEFARFFLRGQEERAVWRGAESEGASG